VHFLIDAQLPPSQARQFSAYGHPSIHVADIGLGTATDKEIWSHATATGAVLVTKDEDFVMMRALDNDGPPVVWVRIGNTTRRALMEHFASRFPTVIAALERGETIVEISGH
jgi:predicted nuclease of predicted toxin-antitoxin system